MVAVVGVMSMLASWTCQWPTKRALAVAEGTAELLGPEGLRLAVLVAGAEDVPVPDVFFEHPAAPIVATTVTTMAKASSRLIIHLSLHELSGNQRFHRDPPQRRQQLHGFSLRNLTLTIPSCRGLAFA